MAWKELVRVGQCPPGSSCEIVVGEQVVALFNVDGNFHALDGICPHQGGPLGEGELTGCIVTCPWHGWQFDVRSGQQQLNKNLLQPRFETKVENGTVWGNLPE
jgi:nitrite reductase (NADH) small subunit